MAVIDSDPIGAANNMQKQHFFSGVNHNDSILIVDRSHIPEHIAQTTKSAPRQNANCGRSLHVRVILEMKAT